MAGRPGLRIGMRSAERGSKSVSFHVTGERWYEVTGLEGGVLHGFWLRCITAVFVYLTHSPVVSQFETALLRPRGADGLGRERPPPKPGGHAVPKSWHLLHAAFRPHDGSLSSSFIPAGRLGTAPFPLALHCVGSVLAVKGSLRRFAPWTAPGRSERRAAYEGKGGVGPCGRAERNLSVIPGLLCRSRGALSPAGP